MNISKKKPSVLAYTFIPVYKNTGKTESYVYISECKNEDIYNEKNIRLRYVYGREMVDYSEFRGIGLRPSSADKLKGMW